MTRCTRRTWITVGAASALSSAFARAESRPEPAKLLCLVLRGGADGRSLVVPYRNPDYYEARPHVAIAPPGSGSDTALRLDDWHAFHPALVPLLPSYQRGELLIWSHVHNPAGTSHLEAERRLQIRAASLGSVTRATGASLAARLTSAGRTLARSDAPDVAWVESEGWDTHVAQRTRLADGAADLAAALSTFNQLYQHDKTRLRVLVVSELGRSLSENDTGGTDHGAASIALLLGSNIPGGRVLGERLGLEQVLRVAAETRSVLP